MHQAIRMGRLDPVEPWDQVLGAMGIQAPKPATSQPSGPAAPQPNEPSAPQPSGPTVPQHYGHTSVASTFAPSDYIDG
jgi:hypothetical protein